MFWTFKMSFDVDILEFLGLMTILTTFWKIGIFLNHLVNHKVAKVNTVTATICVRFVKKSPM